MPVAKKGLSPGIIALIVILCVIAVALILGVSLSI